MSAGASGERPAKGWHRGWLLASLGVALLGGFLLHGQIIHAIADPDTIRVLNVRAYQGALDTGDLLVVVKYRLEYASLPAENANEAYMGRFMDGTSELRAVAPYPYTTGGYTEGVFSFYWTEAEVASDNIVWEGTTYSVRLQGNPSLFPAPPSHTNGTVLWRDNTRTQTELTRDIRDLATELETTWQIDLIESSPQGNILTATGEEYFSNAVVNLRFMIPDIFVATTTTPEFTEREFKQGYVDELQGFLGGSPIDDGFETLSDWLLVPKLMVTTSFLFAIMVAVAGGALKATGGAVEFGLLTVAVTLPLGVILGLTSLTFGVIVGMLSILVLGYVFFYKAAV